MRVRSGQVGGGAPVPPTGGLRAGAGRCGDGWPDGSPGNRRDNVSAPAGGSQGVRWRSPSLGRPSPRLGRERASQAFLRPAGCGEGPGFPPIPPRVLPVAATSLLVPAGPQSLDGGLGCPSEPQRAAHIAPPFKGRGKVSRSPPGLPNQVPSFSPRSHSQGEAEG